jgi:hypothetical protein
VPRSSSSPLSWQKRMVGHCRSKMAVKPLKAEAVLFYSQHPDGRVDLSSLHGGCPVLQGTKWAANLWVWNGPRMPYLLQARRRKKGWQSGGKTTGEVAPSPLDESSVRAVFVNQDASLEDVKLYWQGTVGLPSSLALSEFVSVSLSGRHGECAVQRRGSSELLCRAPIRCESKGAGESLTDTLFCSVC